MKQITSILRIGIKQMTRDGMMVLLLVAPFLMGAAFRFGLPYADTLLVTYLDFTLRPWYKLVDAMLMIMTPTLTALTSAFLLLEEKDEGMVLYYRIMPKGRYGYLAARIIIPMVASFGVAVLTLSIFGISDISISQGIFGCFLSALIGGGIAMMIVCIAGNKVEGLAVSKLAGLCLAGLFAVWFAPPKYAVLSAILPSYWLGDLLHRELNIFNVAGGLLCATSWIVFFTRKYFQQAV